MSQWFGTVITCFTPLLLPIQVFWSFVYFCDKILVVKVPMEENSLEKYEGEEVV